MNNNYSNNYLALEGCTPAISVVMSMYNAAPFLKECIDSILAQTYQDFELIIVDDGSTDNSLEIVNSYNDTRIRLIASDHNYIKSLNVGIFLAKGKYVAKMDADDKMFPNRLEEEYMFMEEHPEVDVCGSNIQVFGMTGYPIQVKTDHKNIAAMMVFQCPLFHPAVIMRMEKIRKLFFSDTECCLYEQKYIYAEDYALWVKMLKNGFKFANIDKTLLYYRKSDMQITYVHRNEQKKVAIAIHIEIAEYIESLILKCNSKMLKNYYETTLKGVKDGIITPNTLFRILSDLYRYYLDIEEKTDK